MWRRTSTDHRVGAGVRHADFAYLDRDDHYLDAACQNMRPQPVIDAVTNYYTRTNACGGRVKYAWGRAVDGGVADARLHTLKALRLSPSTHAVSFTLNTSIGINLLLDQVQGVARVVTSHAEHNSVFLSTITASARLGVPRVVLAREEDGTVRYETVQFEHALVVLSAASNFDGSWLTNLEQLVTDAHSVGGLVVIDAAQAMGHHLAALQGSEADAIVFSGHKLYGPSLGVVVAKTSLLERLMTRFVGGGMVSAVTRDTFTLTPGDWSSRLEPGSQAWAEILGYDAGLQWFLHAKFGGRTATERLADLGERLQAGLAEIPELVQVGYAHGPIASVYSPKVDAHRLAQFASQAGVMLRSGYFCVHHELQERRGLPPLLRFSLGLHCTDEDVDAGLAVIRKLAVGLG